MRGLLSAALLLLGLVASASACGSLAKPTVLTGWKGSFHDGSGEMGTYGNNMDCWWLLRPSNPTFPCTGSTKAGSNCRILLWFELFETEESYDKLYIFDGEETFTDGASTELVPGGLSGQSLPEDTLIRSTKSSLLVRFQSDSYRSFQGFTIRYKTDNDAFLSKLQLSIPLKPVFDQATTTYQAQVGHEQTNCTILTMMNDVPSVQETLNKLPVAVMLMNGKAFQNNYTETLQLISGNNNKFIITITGMDTKTVLNYTVMVLRPADTEARLSSLYFSTGPFASPQPHFSTNVTDYNTSVIYEIGVVVVHATSVDPDVHSIEVRAAGQSLVVKTGTPSTQMPIVAGQRAPIEVIVTAEDKVHIIRYANYIFRPRASRSEFEREQLRGEWRRESYRVGAATTSQEFPDFFGSGSVAMPQTGGNKQNLTLWGNSFLLTQHDSKGAEHCMHGVYEMDTFKDPARMIVDVTEGTGRYQAYQGARLQGRYRITDWPVPATDGLSIGKKGATEMKIVNPRTHTNLELDLAPCQLTSALQPDCTVDAGSVVGADLLKAPGCYDVMPFGQKPWSCPGLAQILGNDTTHWYFQGLRDVNECSDGTSGCSTNSICTNTYGSRWCKCKSGFVGNPYFDMCADVDECAAGEQVHRCGEHTACTNTPGSWNCSCHLGFEGDPAVYTFDTDHDGSIDIVKRPGEDWQCVAVHENHTCAFVPTETDGPLNMRGPPRGVEECERPHAQSHGIPHPLPLWHFDGPTKGLMWHGVQRIKPTASYVRKLTKSVHDPWPRWHYDGRPGDDRSCTDVDECSYKNAGCDKNAYCFNTPGSFSCHCNTGFRGDPYKLSGCVDIDECAEKSHGCSKNAECKNTLGSRTCTCLPGSFGKPYESHCRRPLRKSRVFVTINTWTAEEVQTLSGANAKCGTEAGEPQPGFHWRALLSDGGIDAKHALANGVNSLLYPVIRTDASSACLLGESAKACSKFVIAHNDSQLWGGRLVRPIEYDGHGQRVDEQPDWTHANEVWTGSTRRGSTKAGPGGGETCWSWRDQEPFTPDDIKGAYGNFLSIGGDPAFKPSWDTARPVANESGWLYDGTTDRQGCEYEKRRLYCAEVYFATEGALRSPVMSPHGQHLNTSFFSASASSSLRRDDAFPSYAIDHNLQTSWQSSLNDKDVWFQLDLRTHFSVTAVVVKWAKDCFPAAYSVMLSNSRDAHPKPPTSKHAGWADPSLGRKDGSETARGFQKGRNEGDEGEAAARGIRAGLGFDHERMTVPQPSKPAVGKEGHELQFADNPDWRISHELISQTFRAGVSQQQIPTLLARAQSNRTLLKDPYFSVTALSPPQLARHIRIMVTDPNDLQCHGIQEIEVYAPLERPRATGDTESFEGRTSQDHLLSMDPTGWPNRRSSSPPGWELVQRAGSRRARKRHQGTRHNTPFSHLDGPSGTTRDTGVIFEGSAGDAGRRRFLQTDTLHQKQEPTPLSNHGARAWPPLNQQRDGQHTPWAEGNAAAQGTEAEGSYYDPHRRSQEQRDNNGGPQGNGAAGGAWAQPPGSGASVAWDGLPSNGPVGP